jgi:hypothetical protein
LLLSLFWNAISNPGESSLTESLRYLTAAALEELHRALVPFRLLACFERAQVSALAGLWIYLSRI